MKRNSKLIGFLNGKGFYIALGICMIAIGISGWSALSGINKKDSKRNNSSGTEYVVSSETTVNKTQSNVPAKSSSEKQNSSQTSENTVSAAPVAKYFIYPVNGEIIKGFNDKELQYSLTYNDMRLHTGIDIKANIGTSVKAAGDGKVISVDNDPSFGYTVKIDHGNNIIGIYCGLTEKTAVKKGDTVSAGTNLGALGGIPAECVDAAHLHLEFLKNNKPISPTELLKND